MAENDDKRKMMDEEGRIDPDLLPKHMYVDIAKNLGFNSGDDAAHEAMAEMTPRQALDRYLTWKGLLGGWARNMMDAVDGVRAAAVEREA